MERIVPFPRALLLFIRAEVLEEGTTDVIPRGNNEQPQLDPC